MNHRSLICSRRLRAATLIEVLAGLAILGSVTVALLLARGRLLEQQTLAMHKLEAAKLADGLLANWYAQDDGVPLDANGDVVDHPGWSWRTRVLDTDADAMADTGVVRLELFNGQVPTPGASSTESITSAEAETAIVAVELLVPGAGPGVGAGTELPEAGDAL